MTENSVKTWVLLATYEPLAKVKVKPTGRWMDRQAGKINNGEEIPTFASAGWHRKAWSDIKCIIQQQTLSQSKVKDI